MSTYSVGFDIFAKDRASDVFDKVGNKVDGSSDRMSKFKERAVVAGAVAGAAIVAFGKSSVEAFVDAEKSQRVLEDAYARFPAIADVSIQSLRDQAAALQTKTKFDGDNINAMQGSLAAYKLTGSQIQELTPLILDYAEKTGKDLSTATEDVGKALMGQGRSLKAIGIDFKDAGSTAGNFEQLMGGLRTQVGGFAEKEGASAEGKAEILKNKFGDLQETVGSKLLPVATKLTDWLSMAVTFIDENSTAIGGLIVVGGTIIGMIKAWTIAQAALNIMMTANPIGIIIVAVGALVAAIVWVATQTKFFQTAWKVMTEAIGAAWRWVWNSIIAPIIRFILNGFANLTGGIASFLRALSNIPGFGWAKNAADMMQGASDKARALAQGIRDIPDHKTATVTVRNLASNKAMADSLARALRSIPNVRRSVFIDRIERVARGVNYGVQERASGGRYDAGPLLVGENGPELQFPDDGGFVVNATDTARLLANAKNRPTGGGGGGTEAETIAPLHIQVEGETLVKVLLKIKRTRGGVELGIA